MQIELPDRRRWRTKMEIGLAMADSIEHFDKSGPPTQFAQLSDPERVRGLTLHHHPAGHSVLKRWSTEWGQSHVVGLAGFEPATS
jgi:hypothetical protein